MPPKVSLLKLTQTKAIKKLYENNHVFQDMLVPIDHLEESILKFHEVVQVIYNKLRACDTLPSEQFSLHRFFFDNF